MATVARMISVRLDGQPPQGLGLSELTHLEESVSLVEKAFLPFMGEASDVLRIHDLSAEVTCRVQNACSPDGVIVVYLVGHGWTDSDGGFRTRIGKSCLDNTSGAELMRRLGDLVSPDSRVLLLVDTCEAESLENDLGLLRTGDYTALFASARGERAWNLVADKGTRFAFSISEVLGDAEFLSQPIDAVELGTRLKALVAGDVSTPDQHITRFVHGRPIILTAKSAVPDARRRHLAKRRLAMRLILGSFVSASCLLLATVYWRGHVFVFLDLKGLSNVANQPEIVAYQSIPDTNSIREIKRMRVDGHRSAWLFLPADNLIINIETAYKDGKNRALRFHHVFHPALSVQKSWRIVLPTEEEIASRPGMAFVSADSWLQRSERSKGAAVKPFWIDIEQITVREYYPNLMAMFRSGSIQLHESVLLNDFSRHNDLSTDDLPNNFDTLMKMELNAETLLKQPDCSAPMTEIEARLFAELLGKSTPTRDQWEIAARGVDGRLYPWGGVVDNEAVNAGLPLEVGWEYRRILRPSSQFPLNESPFGMRDVVGNAGDWVCDEGQFGFMGGELRLNPDDCTTFSYMRLPSSQAGLADFAWWVGFRGTLPSKL